MASVLPSSVLLLSIRAALFLASRRFLTNALGHISLAAVSTAADGLDETDDSGRTSPLIPLSRKMSAHALSLLGVGGGGSASASSSSAVTPPPDDRPQQQQREPFARQGSDANLPALGLARERSASGSTTAGGRWFDRRGRRAADEGEKRLRGSNTSQLIFPLLFSESIMLYLLVLCQSLSLLPARARQLHWALSLWALVLLLVGVVPGVQGWVLMRGSRKRGATTRLGLTAIPFFSMQILFYLLPVPAHMLHASSASWLDPAIARLGVIGVLVLGALSGVGSINTALLFYSRSASSSWEEVTSDDLLSAERSLRSIGRDIADREVEKERRASVGSASAGAAGGRGWFGRLLGSVKSEDSSLELELKGLRLMRDEVSRNLRGMVLRRERMRFSKTLKGRVWNFAGYLFAIYCVLRLLLTIPSLLSPASSLSASPSADAPTQTTGDWLSYLLALGLAHLPFEVDVALWSRLISLGLAGLIVASSVEYVLGWVRRVLGRVGGGRRGVGELGALILGQLMALYLLSLLIQLRNSLPPSSLPAAAGGSAAPALLPLEPDGPEPQLLASLPPFKAFNRLLDLAYLFGALVTALTAYLGGFLGADAGGVGDGGVEIWRDDDP